MVDLIEYLENVDERLATFAILSIMILQSPILTFPGYILMIYAGFRFGLIAGAIINYIGLYISCIIGYRFGKWSSTDLTKGSNPKMQKLNDLINEKGDRVVLFLRIFPIIPNNVTSIGSGFVNVSEKKHSIYSGFSIIQSFFWSFLGSIILRNQIRDLKLELTIYHGLVLVALFLFLVYVRYRINSNN